MKLTTITAHNFKGLSFHLDLQDINFLIGSNFAGKTARTDAIRFLLLGYLPELGKTNVASFGLSSGREMRVSGRFDNGSEIHRTLRLEGNSVRATNQIPPEIEACGQLAVMLNAETYFELSDAERVKYVFANVQMGPEWTTPEILGKIQTALPPEKREDADSTIVSHSNKLLIQLARLMKDHETPQAFVDAALAWLTTEAKSAKDYVGRMEKTVQGLSALKAADGTTSTATAEQLQAQRATILAQIERDQDARSGLTSDHLAITNSRPRRQDINTLLSCRPALIQKKDNVLARLEAANAVDLGELVTPEEITNLDAAERASSRSLAQLDSEIRRMEENMECQRAEEAGIHSKTICPYCGAQGDGWKTLKLAEIASALAGMTGKRLDLQARRKAATEETNRIIQNLNTLRQRHNTRTQHERTVLLLQSELSSVEASLAKTNDLPAELERLPKENPELEEKMARINKEIADAKLILGVIDQKIKEANGREQDKLRLAQAETERDTAKTELETIITVGKKLREIQADMVKAAFDPLLAIANTFFPNILKTEIAYHDGEIGTWRDGVWVTHRTFSGIEKLLTYAAIQASLAAKSPVKIMLIDELGRIHDDHLVAFVHAIDDAIISGRLHQFVGIETGRASIYQYRIEHSQSQDSAQVIQIQ